MFLSYFYEKQKSGHVLFKGGTAIRFLYNSPRFSEDLDFTAYNIISLAEKGLIEEKIQALLDRAKPRDFYDIYFLLRANLSTPKNTLPLRNALKKLEGTKIDFKRELMLFLPKSHHNILKDFKNILKRELEKHVR